MTGEVPRIYGRGYEINLVGSGGGMRKLNCHRGGGMKFRRMSTGRKDHDRFVLVIAWFGGQLRINFLSKF